MPIICDNCGFHQHSDSFYLHRPECPECPKRKPIKPKNRIIEIGYKGIAYAFLNIPREEAIARYCKAEDTSREQFDIDTIPINEFEFDDVFGSYSAWALNENSIV